MKKVFLILFLLSFVFVSSQTKIDHFVSVSFPQEPSKLDTILGKVEIKSFYLNDDIDNYQASITKIISSENSVSSLPYDKKSLNSFYDGLINGQSDRMSESGFTQSNSKEVKIDRFLARQVSFIDAYAKKKNMEFIHLVLNEYSYSFGYIALDEFDTTKASTFLGSIHIDDSNSPSQYVGKRTSENIGYITGKYTVYALIIFLVLWLILKNRKK